MPNLTQINLEPYLPDLVPQLVRRCWQMAKLVVPADEPFYNDLVFKVAVAVLEDQILMLHRKGYMVLPIVRTDAAFSCVCGVWTPNERRIWYSCQGWYQRIRDCGGVIPGEYLG